jgi:hypothetical protein
MPIGLWNLISRPKERQKLSARAADICTYERESEDRLCGLEIRVPGYRCRGPGFDSRHYEILWEVVGLERGSLSFVSTTEEVLGWKCSGSGLEIQ